MAGREEEGLNSAISWPLERESQEEEWYVDALAVFTDWGRGGIGTRLLKAAEQEARQHSYPKVALNVTRENKQVLSLYERLQYTAECQKIELSCR